MNDTPSPQIEDFNRIVSEVEVLLFITRDAELQRDAIAQLSSLAAQVTAWKEQALREGRERDANIFLGCSCVIRSLQAELNMWLSLKDAQPDAAWEHLIESQAAAADAVRADPGFRHVESRAKKLDAIERCIFPPQRFVSAGLIVRNQECSICGMEYEDCPHLVGMPYWGEFCRIRLLNAQPDHVALVDDPANKLCRITHFQVEGGRRNRMTWGIEPDDTKPSEMRGPNGEEGLTVSGIILTKQDV